MRESWRAFAPFLFLLNMSDLHAADDGNQTDSDNPVVVTATRVATTADETLAAVSVITRSDIERTQAMSLHEVLRSVPGVSLTNSGGMGKTTSLFLRGTESDHVLVLIDGVKVGSATLGTTAFQDLPIEQVERIEIVRGPRSSLYGSEAIGGVIQIFTRKGEGALRPSFSMTAGRYQTRQLTAGISGGNGINHYAINMSMFDSDGFDACPTCTADSDDDGYQNNSTSVRVGHRFANESEVELHGLVTEAENEFDSTFVNSSETRQHAYGIRYHFLPLDTWVQSITIGRSNDESDNFLDGVFRTRFDTQRDTASWLNDVTISDTQRLAFGLDYNRDQVESTTIYTVGSRDNRGLFAQYQTAIGRHHLQAALRGDDNEQFDKKTTGSAAWAMDIRSGLRVRASYGTAFKAPTFNELYFPGFGNAGLRPETSQTAELGLALRNRHYSTTLDLFETEVEELIAFDAATFAPANIDEAQIQGIEWGVDSAVFGWQLGFSATVQRPENRSNDSNNGKLLTRRAQQILHVDADRQLGTLSLGATLHAEGRRFDDLANSTRLAGFGVIDLRGEYALDDDWRVQARVGNLLDKRYQTASSFEQAGREFYLTLRYQPDVSRK